VSTQTQTPRRRAESLYALLSHMPPDAVATMTNQDIADALGTSPRHASRMLAQLVEAGLIRLTYGPPNRWGIGSAPSGRTIEVVEVPR
jgi:CRP-like cAMP-binding protein